jgi:hypothetical protein
VACRAVVQAGAAGGRLTLDDPDAHLTYEQIEAMAEGRAPLDEHARECEMCAAEVRDLRTLVEKRRWSRVPWWLPAGAVLAASIALAVFLTSRPSDTPVPAPARMATIRDGALTLTVDGQGRIAGAPFDTTAVNAALAAGTIEAGAAVRDWRRDREQLLGDGPAASGTVIAPVAETVESDRPVFRWTAVKGASSYRVEVYDSKFDEVASSGPVAATEWRPERPLPRGAAYTWVVAAGSTRFPQPPAPEARFEVLAVEAAAEVERARASGSRLLLAVAAGRHGLWGEARTAVDEVARENPANEAIQRLHQSVESRAKK